MAAQAPAASATPTTSAPAQPPVKASPPAEAPQMSDMDAFEAYASQGPDDDFGGYSGQSPDEAFDDYPTTTKPPATRPGAGRAGASRAAPPARPAVARPAASPATAAPDTPAASPVSPASNGTIALNEPWASLAARLPLRGLAAQLAQQSEWVAVDGATVVLRVATKTLAEGAGVERLRVVLETHFGLPVRLRFEIGKTGDNTAYAAAVSERLARQEAAEQTIMADPFVRDLLDQFGGKIVPDSIRPVTPEAQQGTPS
jgi:DNA polymerase-3 subunit gamma/tau